MNSRMAIDDQRQRAGLTKAVTTVLPDSTIATGVPTALGETE